LKILIFTDFHRGSYKIIGELFEDSLKEFGQITQKPTSKKSELISASEKQSSCLIVLHNTLGDSFNPLPECYNIGLPAHEWSEYPRKWIGHLNKFNEIWATTDHVRELLTRGGLQVPAYKLPPALDREIITVKKDWQIKGLPKFLFIGEPHFRKGHHLLMEGFIKAFPNCGEAILTIKTSPSCDWESPREDIFLIKEDWSRERLLSEYSKHDCFVSASLAEGLGLPIAEAIMAELPICTNYWGGHRCLLHNNDFIRIEHEEIIQPYSSKPEFFADGQKCAYSSPRSISNALKHFVKQKAETKQKMSLSLKNHFLKTYGTEPAANKIKARLSKISAKIS